MIILRITGRFRYPPDATNLDQCEASRIFLLRRLSRDLSRRSAKHEAGSGGIYIAWGVSPRWCTSRYPGALKGRQIAAAA